MLDLSNEELKIIIGKGAAKVSKVQVGGRKRYLSSVDSLGLTLMRPGLAELADFFLTSNFDL